MTTINVVTQSGHAWEEEYGNLTEAKDAIPAIVKEHGDIERVELVTPDGPVDLWVCEYERKRAASILGRMGGSVTSKRKSKSSAANGKLGGRPKKTNPQE